MVKRRIINLKKKKTNSILCYKLLHRNITDTKLFIAFDRKWKAKKIQTKRKEMQGEEEGEEIKKPIIKKFRNGYSWLNQLLYCIRFVLNKIKK